jgi:hypothetical protein
MLPNRHHVRRYMTERRVNGVKTGVYVFACGPCGVTAQEFVSRSKRDRLAAEHEAIPPK